MASRWFGFILLLAAPLSLRAQDGAPQLRLEMPQRIVAGVDAPSVSLSDVLTEGHRRELLNSGFSAALHCRVELWKKGLFFFGLESVVEWDVIVDYVPATKVYQVRRVQGGRLEDLGEVRSIEEAEQIVDRPYRVPMPPRARGKRYYYSFSVDISTLQLSDLDAWQRWVRGEAEPAVQGKKNPATAIQRGLGSLLSRVLGGETQSYEKRSGPFSAG